MEKYTLSVLVENHPGILTKVSGLFSRRGFNIESLAVGTTQDDDVSRITIEVIGNEQTVEQIAKQLSKSIDVIKLKTLKESDVVKRCLVLVKIKSNAKVRSEIIEIANIFRAKIVDIHANTLTVEITGGESKVEAFIDMVKPFGIEEIARTGITALERGSSTLKM